MFTISGLFSGEKNDLQIVLYLSEMEVELDETSRKFLQNNYIFPEVTYGDGQRSTGINNNLFLMILENTSIL